MKTKADEQTISLIEPRTVQMGGKTWVRFQGFLITKDAYDRDPSAYSPSAILARKKREQRRNREFIASLNDGQFYCGHCNKWVILTGHPSHLSE